MDELEQLEWSIYEAAVVPERWSAVLGKLSEAVDAKGGVFFGVSPSANHWTASESIRPAMEHFVSSGWALRSTRMSIGLSRGLQYEHRFVTEADYGEGIEREPVYREFFYPYGLGHSAGTVVMLPHDDLLCISFERGVEQGAFPAAGLSRLNAVRPQLLRAALLTTRLGLAQIHTAISALSAIGLPAVAVTQAGRIVEANASFGEARHIWTTRGGNRIALLDREADGMLRSTLETKASASIPVRDGETRRLCSIVQTVPLKGVALDIFGTSASILILSEAKTDKDLSLVSSLFDLTPAELDVARGLVAGLSVTAIAARRGRSVATVRNQLRGILSKTGCSRQADLVALLGTVLFASPGARQ